MSSVDKKYLDQIHSAVQQNLKLETEKISGILPFLKGITQHMVAPHQNSTRSLTLLKSASLVAEPDQNVYDIGSTLEYLHTATSLHKNIKQPENARRKQRHISNLWGNEASVLLGDYLLSISFQILTKVGNLDVLESISWATQKISKAQVLEITETHLTATPDHWRQVVLDKDAGLFAAGAQSAGFWGNMDSVAVEKFYRFGEHVGLACSYKSDIEILDDEKKFLKNIKDKNLWLPLSFLLFECMESQEREEYSNHLEQNESPNQLIDSLKQKFEENKVKEKLVKQAVAELNSARAVLEEIEMDTSSLNSLTNYELI